MPFDASTVRFKVMLFHTMTFVTTRQSSNKFDFALAAPKVLSPTSYESGIAERLGSRGFSLPTGEGQGGA